MITSRPTSLLSRAVAIAVLLLAAAANRPVPLAAQEMEELKQIELTDKQVAGFIAAQKDLQPLSSKLLEGGDKPDDALKGELDAIARATEGRSKVRVVGSLPIPGIEAKCELKEVGQLIAIRIRASGGDSLQRIKWIQ